jgi:hypothetical protein
MAKHSMPTGHSNARTAMFGAAVASGVIYIALAGAGTAAAKTHHGVDAPGNPFSDEQIAAGYQSTGSSFTTVRVVRSGQGGGTIISGPTTTREVVSMVGGTTVRSSGGLLSGRGGASTANTGPSSNGSPGLHPSGNAAGSGGRTSPGTNSSSAGAGTSRSGPHR